MHNFATPDLNKLNLLNKYIHIGMNSESEYRARLSTWVFIHRYQFQPPY